MMQSYFPINRFLEALETNGLNILGYIPFVSSISGSLRIMLAQLQIFGGFIFGVLKILIGLFVSNARIKESHFTEAGILFIYLLHGILNLIRGTIEAVPFLGLILCLPYDRCFHFRFPYVTRSQR